MARRPVSIVILTHNNLSYTRSCLEAIEATTEDYQVVVVDNASSDGTPEYLARLEEESSTVKVLLNKSNRGFAAGCNQGVAASRHGTICLLNNDTIPFEGWLDSLVDVMEKGVGAVGAKLLLPDHTLQHCGIEFSYREEPGPHFWPYHRYLGFPEEIAEANSLEAVPGVTGACLLTSRTVWDRVGGMDEGYLVANFEDVDFNLKIRDVGMEVLYQPASRLIHFWGTTVAAKRGDADSPSHHFQSNYDRLMNKWFQKLRLGMATS